MQQFAFSLQLLDDETLSNQLLCALAAEPELVPEPTTHAVTSPKTPEMSVPADKEPMEPNATEPVEPKEPETPKEFPPVKIEVKEEEQDEWEATKWWEGQDDEDWYWEGVEEEEPNADEIEWVSWPPAPPPPKPVQPKKMPGPPGPPGPPAWPPPPPPPPAGPPPDGGRPRGVKAPWAWDTRDKPIRTDKYGGTVYKSGWYQTRSGDWWPLLGAASDSF